MKKIKLQTIVKFIILVLIVILMVTPVYIVAMMGTYKSEKLFLGIPWIPSNYLLNNIKTVIPTVTFAAC